MHHNNIRAALLRGDHTDALKYVVEYINQAELLDQSPDHRVVVQITTLRDTLAMAVGDINRLRNELAELKESLKPKEPVESEVTEEQPDLPL